MYRYKTVKNSETIWNYKNALIKFSLPGIFKYIGIIDMLLAFYWVKIIELIGSIGLYILAGTIIFQVTMIIIYSKKFMDSWLELVINTECEIGFNEEGIKIIDENEELQFSWKAISDIKVYEDYMIIVYRIKDMPSQILLFDSFNEHKDEIIEEINKYKQARGE